MPHITSRHWDTASNSVAGKNTSAAGDLIVHSESQKDIGEAFRKKGSEALGYQ